MPELHFNVRWPDQTQARYYSPSSTVKDFLHLEQRYPVREFLVLSRSALEHASERVRQKWGYPCAMAAAEILAIERHAARFLSLADAVVVVESFDA